MSALNARPDTEIWSLMERFHAVNTNHCFVACRPDRPTASYTVDFSSADALDYVPVMRDFSRVSGNEIVVMPNGRVPLNAAHAPFVRLVDGRRTIREIAALVAGDYAVADVETLARNAFQSLWRVDLLAMARTSASLIN